MNIDEAEARRAYLIEVLRFDASEKTIEAVDKILRDLNLPPLKRAEALIKSAPLPIAVQEQKEKMLPEKKKDYFPVELPPKYFA